MESRVNYTIVGLFVVLLFAGLISFGYWLGNYGGKQESDHYYVYISESVAGLSTDASVKYRGVDVGTVEHIDINSENPEEVELLLNIKRDTPIKLDTRAKLKSFGITGLVFIELTGSSKDSPLLKKSDGEIPVIPASPSMYAQIDESLRQLAEKSNMALDKFDRLFGDENLNNVASILSEINILTKDLRNNLALDKLDRLFSDENLNNVASILSETNRLTRDLGGQLQGLQKLIDNGIVMEKHVTKAFKKVETASVSMKNMTDSLEKNYADVGRNMSQDVRQGLKSFNGLLYELEMLAGQLQKTIQSIEDSPSDLLFKHTNPRPGPGEKGYNEK